MCGIACIIQDITSSLFDLKTPFWGHHTYYIINHVHCICVITPTLSMISQPLYIWYHFQYMGENLSTIFLTSYPLCLTTQPWVLITPHLAYVWHHLCYSRCHIHFRHDNTARVSDITPTISMSSYHLHWHLTHFCMTSHPLLCDIIWTIYNITPDPYVITLLYLWHHNLYILNHIKYEENIYT